MLQGLLGAFFGTLASMALYEVGRRRDECISTATERLEIRIMAKLVDLKNELAGVASVITQVSNNIDTLLNLIADLKNQQGSGGEITAADLDGLHEEVKAMRATLVEVHDKSDDFNPTTAT